MADHHVEIDNLVKTYPGALKPSVDHVSLSCRAGKCWLCWGLPAVGRRLSFE